MNVRENQVPLRKRCAEHGEFEARVYGDAQMYVDAQRFNIPGNRPLTTQTEASGGYAITLDQCVTMFDAFLASEGDPGNVMLSSGEPTIRPDILAMIDLAPRPRLEALAVDCARVPPVLEAARSASRDGVLDYVLNTAEKPCD